MAAIITPYATLSFPTLFSPRPRSKKGNAEAVYSCQLLFRPEVQKTPEFKALQEAAKEAFIEEFGEKAFQKGIVSPFRKAEEKDQYKADFAGWVFISPWTKNKPGIVDALGNDVLVSDEVYAGQEVRAYVNPFAWDSEQGKGVSFGLNGLQIVKKDAPRIDGRVPLNKVFGAIEGAEAEMADDDSPF